MLIPPRIRPLGTFYGFTIWQTWSSPVSVYLNTGNFVVMLRYGQWLFCTPVLLAFVSNMTGQHKSYSQNNINMIIADVMAVTIFVFSCLAVEFWAKIWCYIISVAGFTYLYFLAWRVRTLLLVRSSHHNIPSQNIT